LSGYIWVDAFLQSEDISADQQSTCYLTDNFPMQEGNRFTQSEEGKV